LCGKTIYIFLKFGSIPKIENAKEKNSIFPPRKVRPPQNGRWMTCEINEYFIFFTVRALFDLKMLDAESCLFGYNFNPLPLVLFKNILGNEMDFQS